MARWSVKIFTRRIPKKAVQPPSATEWLKSQGFSPLSGGALDRAFQHAVTPQSNREVFLRALAGGLQPGSKLAREYWAPGGCGIIATGVQVLQNSLVFNRFASSAGPGSHNGATWCREYVEQGGGGAG